jgi:hypothetical protein
MPNELFEELYSIYGTLLEIQKIEIKDNFFENDEKHKALKKISIKAYKHLKDYEYNKRFNYK